MLKLSNPNKQLTGSPPNLVVLSNLNKQFGDNSIPLSCAT
jgi:hypothetical protein